MEPTAPQSISILVVDDEENLRRTMAMILTRQGYRVSTAASIHEARLRLREASYDLVFLDLKLPDASGLSLLPDIRETYPQMPVLVLTAHDRLEAATEAVRLGARDFLLKPVDPALIIQRVKEVLAESSQSKPGRSSYSNLQKLLRDQKLEGSPEPQPPEKEE
jgi:DNA-binding NtrC family response regulator